MSRTRDTISELFPYPSTWRQRPMKNELAQNHLRKKMERESREPEGYMPKKVKLEVENTEVKQDPEIPEYNLPEIKAERLVADENEPGDYLMRTINTYPAYEENEPTDYPGINTPRPQIIRPPRYYSQANMNTWNLRPEACGLPALGNMNIWRPSPEYYAQENMNIWSPWPEYYARGNMNRWSLWPEYYTQRNMNIWSLSPEYYARGNIYPLNMQPHENELDYYMARPNYTRLGPDEVDLPLDYSLNNFRTPSRGPEHDEFNVDYSNEPLDYAPTYYSSETNQKLRACVNCGLLKTLAQFCLDGCDNCEHVFLFKLHPGRVLVFTSLQFYDITQLTEHNRTWKTGLFNIHHELHVGAYAQHVSKFISNEAIEEVLPDSAEEDNQSDGICRCIRGWQPLFN